MENRLDTIDVDVKDNLLLINDKLRCANLAIRKDDISSISLKKGKRSWYIRVMSRTGYHWKFGCERSQVVLKDHYNNMIHLWKLKCSS